MKAIEQAKLNIKRWTVSLLAALAVLVTVRPAFAEFGINRNDLDAEARAQYDKIVDTTAAHNFFWGLAWSPEFFSASTGGATAWSLNLGLKNTRPILQPPDDFAVIPNSGNSCEFRMDVTNNSNEYYEDYLGLGPAFAPGAPRMTGNWGLLGQPIVGHGNTEVRIHTTLNGQSLGKDIQAERILPIGRHGVGYEAVTQFSELFDVPPWFSIGMFSSLHVAKKSGAVQALTWAASNLATNFGPIAFNEIGVGATKDARARWQRFQRFYVLDNSHPTFTQVQSTRQIEATNVGGRVLTPGLAAQIRRETLQYEDRCRDVDDLEIRLTDAPPFLDVGQDYVVTWRLLDPGPSSLNPNPGGDPDFPDLNFDDQRNETRVTQTWRIRDTVPPLIKPPIGRVVETDNSAQDVELGVPAVFDAADPLATIVPLIDGVPVEGGVVSMTAPSRQRITWSATDDSMNNSQRSQWLTLKPSAGPDANTPPVAIGNAVQAVSFEPLQIDIFGQDNDFIDGRYDQLSFAIETPPENGNFIAPLFPFFIEDYRIESQLSNEQGELVNPLEMFQYFKDWCEDPFRRQDPIPRDWVREPRYIAVTDDGTTYVRDLVTRCNVNDPATDPRIARFDADGELVAEIVFPTDFDTVRSFWIGADGFLYFKDPNDAIIVRVDPTPVDDDPNRPPRMMSTRLRLHPPNDENGFVRSLRDLRSVATDANGLLYVTDGAAAYAFDMTREQPGRSGSILFVGDLVPRFEFSPEASTNGEMDMTIDSKGNVYFADEELHRIWKYSPSSLNRETDEFTPGEQIGWAGRCSGNKTSVAACSVEHQRSFGFACTDALCQVDRSLRDHAADREACGLPDGASLSARSDSGCAPGQFDKPRGIAINSNDILYVADFNNARIQRFDTNGMYGGQSVSNGDGSSFVLGDFGKPIDVAVNKDNFYVLDTENYIMHSFKTTPITNVEEAELNLVQNAFVTYQSNNGFTGTDQFTFTTSDGLADSAASAPVLIDVARNFRPPEAISGISASTDEDIAVEIELVGTDPDGDDLRYTIVEQPANGRVEGDGSRVTYVPNADFNGTDAFWFAVDDGLTSAPAMSSPPARVQVDVAPVDDDPVITVKFADHSSPEYDMQFGAVVEDPDEGDVLNLTVEWGDGRISRAQRDDTQAVLQMYDDFDFEARIQGSHAYANPGTYTYVICASDDPSLTALSNCGHPAVKSTVQGTIRVEQLVDLVVETSDSLAKSPDPNCPDGTDPDACPELSSPLVDGDLITYTTTIHNVQHGDFGDTANDIELFLEFPEELVPVDVDVSQANSAASFNIAADRVDIQVAQIPIGQSATVMVTAASPGTLTEQHIVDVLGNVTSDVPDPSGRNPVAFKTTIDLDPDADPDGDGVPNRDDAFPQDPLESSDVDRDGIGDNADIDNDNDLLPDFWERRYGYDPRNSGDQLQDADGDGLTNLAEYRKGSHPESTDSDRDGLNDGSDNCPADFNRNQFDSDGDSTGDSCDVRRVTAVAAIGDLNANAAADFVLTKNVAGAMTAFIKDSASDESVGASTIQLADSGSTIHANIATSGDALMSAMVQNGNGQIALHTWDANNGAMLNTTDLFDARWQTVSLESLGGAEWLAVANHERGYIGIERRRADTGAVSGSAIVPGDAIAVDAASANDGLAYAILAVNLDTGELELLVLSSATDEIQTRTTIADSRWLKASVASTSSGFATLVQRMSGEVEVNVLDIATNVIQASFPVFDSSWTALDISAFGADTTDAADALAIMVADQIGEIRIAIFDSATGAVISENSYHTASDAPRALVAATVNGIGHVGSLASSANDDVVLELRSVTGGDQRTVSAAESSPVVPPPPPPSPPPTDTSGGGGGGSLNPWLLLSLLLVHALSPLRRGRRDQRCNCLCAAGINGRDHG